MRVTPSECSGASGICLNTVYRHLNDETLRGEKSSTGRWHIDRGEFFAWVDWAWSSGKYWMHSPQWAKGFIDFAGIDSDEQNKGRRGRKRT